MKLIKPQRTLKAVIDLHTLETITSDELLSFDVEGYNTIRRRATGTRLIGEPRYTCLKCGYGAYAPRSGRTAQPLWKHFKGAPKDCPWYTGESRDVDDVSASQFNGVQESYLHLRLKNEIAEILNSQEHVSDVVVDKYFVGENGRRRPDVRATFQDKKIAFEIQLAHTQLPIIMQRENFYKQEQMHLIWVTWGFEPRELHKIPQSILDVYFSQHKTAFSLDSETIELSKASKALKLRAYHESQGNWVSGVFDLSNLIWTSDGLPYAFQAIASKEEAWLERWITNNEKGEMPYALYENLLQEAIDHLNLGTNVEYLRSRDAGALLNAVLSLMHKKPIGSRQSNLTEVLNTFLTPPRRHSFASIIWAAAWNSNNIGLLLDKPSTKQKYATASTAEQEDTQSLVWKFITGMVPELFKQPWDKQ